jgi:hypothetical protein
VLLYSQGAAEQRMWASRRERGPAPVPSLLLDGEEFAGGDRGGGMRIGGPPERNFSSGGG